MVLLPNYFAWTYGRVADHIRGTVLELGCGAGIGIESYRNRASRVVAIDYNDALLERVRARYGNDPKLETRHADLTDDWNRITDLSADTIIMMDVLEHFRDDETFVRRASSLLVPGGKLIIKVPAQKALYGKRDVASGHYRRYDEDGLEHVTRTAGLETRSIRHINPLGAFAYRRKKDRPTTFSKTFSEFELRTINRLVPFIRLADWIPFLPGLSLLGVFEKTG